MKNQKASDIYMEYYDAYLYCAEARSSFESEKIFYKLGFLVEIWEQIARCLNASRNKNSQEFN